MKTLLFALTIPLIGWTKSPALYRAIQIPTTDGLVLKGQLATPQGTSGPFPAVLLLPGLGRAIGTKMFRGSHYGWKTRVAF